MAFEVTTILELLVLITWTALSQPVYMNALFKQLFFDAVVVSEIASAASLSFCPGLFEAIQAGQPPALSFFKSLPSASKKQWAVYALVLEKQGARSLVYIGSGTQEDRGVLGRWFHYDNPKKHRQMLPEYVRTALDDGYQIVHKGVLVWSTIPGPTNVPMFRLLFIAMEATFSFLFWAMRSTSKDYGIGFCCPWPRDSFTYGGLCSHNPLFEKVNGNFGLSAEQLEALAADTKEKTRLYQAEYDRSRYAKDPEFFRAKSREVHATAIKTPAGKLEVQASRKRQYDETMESKKYYCDVCSSVFDSPAHLARHDLTPKHLKAVKEAEACVIKKYYCKVCNITTQSPFHLRRHNEGPRHLKRVAREAKSAKGEPASESTSSIRTYFNE